MTTIRKFQDTGDESYVGIREQLLLGFRRKDGPTTMESFNHSGEGGATEMIYHGSKLVGMLVTARDPMNWVYLIEVDFRPIQSGRPLLD